MPVSFPPQDKFNVILADPPWTYSDKCNAGQRGATYKYQTMSIDAIRRLPVATVAADDCALFLWTTMPQIPVAISVLQAWEFEFKTVAFTWVKTSRNSVVGSSKPLKWHWGMGNWTRSNPELVLLGIRGRPRRASAAVHSVVMSPVREHSRKPDEVRNRIVQLMGDVPRCELFARPPLVDGWAAWGNEVDCDFRLGEGIGDRLRALRGRARNLTGHA